MINEYFVTAINKALSSLKLIIKPLYQDSFEVLEGGAGEVGLYKFIISDIAYVVRIIPSLREKSIPQELDNAIVASREGYGPKIYYNEVSRHGGICIMEFLENDYRANRLNENFLALLTSAIQKMHRGSSFSSSKTLVEFLVEMNEWLEKNNISYPTNSMAEISIYHANIKILREIWGVFEKDIRPVHHDLNPTNIVYNGKNLTIIDFDTAAQDVFYLDLCVAANFYCVNDKEEERLLDLYFEGNLSQVEIHKFNFIQPFAFILHALWLASSAILQELPSQEIIRSFSIYHELRIKLINNELDLTLKENILALSMQMFKQGIDNMMTKAFEESIKVLAI